MSNINSNEPIITPTPPESDAAKQWSDFSAAFERKRAEIAAVPESELVPLNIDVHAAIATVLGALPEITAMRDRFAKLIEIDQTRLDGLEDYARAAAEANSRWVTATTPTEDIVALNEKAIATRETLRSDAMALAKRGLIDPGRLAAFQGLVGYKNVGFDLIDMANLLHECWPQIQNKTALTSDEITAAKDLGERLVRAAGLKEQAPAAVAEVARTRQQAVTLLVKAYDQARRAVGYLRWNQSDADTVAPSLYARPRKPDATANPAKPVNPATPPNAPVTPPATNAVTPSAAAAPAVAPGMPGASPFAN